MVRTERAREMRRPPAPLHQEPAEVAVRRPECDTRKAPARFRSDADPYVAIADRARIRDAVTRQRKNRRRMPCPERTGPLQRIAEFEGRSVR